MKFTNLFKSIFYTVMIMTSAAFAHADDYAPLTKKQVSIIKISAYTGNGDLDKLKPAFVEGLKSGVTVNEIKEIMAHLYAYAGFPRALNGQTLFMKLMTERQTEGIKDVVGKTASPIPADLNRDKYGAEVRAKLSGLDEVPPEAAWQRFNPVMDQFLKEHLFADIFARDVLDHKTRELVTISALSAISGTSGQLKYHINAAMNVGNTKEELKGFVSVITAEVGKDEGGTASKVLNSVLENRK